MLESDLSSVFQLYNMRSPEHKLNKTAANNIKDGISTLVEENAKLKVELKDTQEEKRDLQLQLKNAKVCTNFFIINLRSYYLIVSHTQKPVAKVLSIIVMTALHCQLNNHVTN